MLVSTRELLDRAYKNKTAIGAFNTYNLELTNAIIRAAQALRVPVILQLNSGALRYGGYDTMTALARTAAESAEVPVGLHLDHATSVSELERAIAAGFTSVMIDGSKLSFEENIALTRSAVLYAHAHGIPVEAELGRLSGAEDAAHASEPSGEMTDPTQAQQFVAETGVDFLAVCVGNVHGFYRSEPRLDLMRLELIHTAIPIPLVLHGTSGLADDTIRQAMARGVAKFNLNTELRVGFFDALERVLNQPHPEYDLPKVMSAPLHAVQTIVEEKLALLNAA